jgi:C4-dicarboxylate transporter DctM subunit
MTEESIGALFLAGIVPGLLLGAALMARVYFLSRHRQFPRDHGIDWTEVRAAARSALLPLLMPVGVLGGLIAGFFTPTEAGAVAVIYALVLSLGIFRSVKLGDLPGILVETMITTAVVTFVISVSSSFSFLLAIENAANRIAAIVTALTENKYMILLLFNLVLLVLGAVMEAGVVLILFTPILYPIAVGVGVDPIHFGVIMVVNLMIGVATPPVGVSLFVMSHVSGVRLETLMREVLPFIWPLLLVLLVVTYFPELVLWLPNMWISKP